MTDQAASLALLRNRILSPLDEHFARAMGRIGKEDRREVLLAAALASRFVRSGHVCFDVPRFAAAPEVVAEGDEKVAVEWPAVEPWLSALRDSSLVSFGASMSESRPLVLDESGRLYLRRYWEHQAEVIAAIRRRV